MVTAAKDVKLQVEFNPVHVSAWRLIGYDNRRLNDADFANDAKDAGDLGAGHAITALYELAPPSASDAGSYGVKLKYQEPPAAQTGHAEEVATVKIRYKEPTASSSRELQFAVAHGLQDAPSPDFRFAAGVAQFGMVLRDSAHRGSASLDSAVQLVEDAIGEDADGLRAEFVYLAKLARDLQRATARR
ncbi:MAG: DUF3520 domain-containing protein [Bryobacteraceae bacterium]